jgi:hypothetical protein
MIKIIAVTCVRPFTVDLEFSDGTGGERGLEFSPRAMRAKIEAAVKLVSVRFV